jgi:hypothetical protein
MAAGTAIAGIFLLIEGAMAIWALQATSLLAANPGEAAAVTIDGVGTKRLQLLLYWVAAEGLVFGPVALISALGLHRGRAWAHRVLLPASVFLALVAGGAIAIAPQTWDIQGVFILVCALYWWESEKITT